MFELNIETLASKLIILLVLIYCTMCFTDFIGVQTDEFSDCLKYKSCWKKRIKYWLQSENITLKLDYNMLFQVAHDDYLTIQIIKYDDNIQKTSNEIAFKLPFIFFIIIFTLKLAILLNILFK